VQDKNEKTVVSCKWKERCSRVFFLLLVVVVAVAVAVAASSGTPQLRHSLAVPGTYLFSLNSGLSVS